MGGRGLHEGRGWGGAGPGGSGPSERPRCEDGLLRRGIVHGQALLARSGAWE